MVAPAGLKSTALSMSLSSICTIRSGAPVSITAAGGQLDWKLRARGRRRGRRHRRAAGARRRSKLDALGAADRLLHAGGGAHRHQDRAQALAALARPLEVGARRGRHLTRTRGYPARSARWSAACGSRGRACRRACAGTACTRSAARAGSRSCAPRRRVHPARCGLRESGHQALRVRADSLARRSRASRSASHAAKANIAVTATTLVTRVRFSMRVRA